MSRTDKDTPWWVVAELWEAYHWRCVNAQGPQWNAVRRDRDCDLPADPVVSAYHGARRRHGRNCHWLPVWSREANSRVQPHPPGWYIDHVWTNATRRSVRDDCIKAAKEYRATADVDTIPKTEPHRHCAAWLYW